MNQENNIEDNDSTRFNTPSLFPRADSEKGVSSAELFHHPKNKTIANSESNSKMSALLVLVAQVVSTLYSPFYLPVMAFIVLFLFSYMKLLPLSTKIVLIAIVYFFTILLPHTAIYFFRRFNGWTRKQLSKRQRRFVPYGVCIISYGILLYLFYEIHMPHFTIGVIGGALAIIIICAIVNSRIKISTHAAASGGVIGALIAFAFIFSFDPTNWLCLATLLCGMTCSSRLILRQHTYREIGWGVTVGILSGFVSVLLI